MCIYHYLCEVSPYYYYFLCFTSSCVGGLFGVHRSTAVISCVRLTGVYQVARGGGRGV
jgi:hypothetical protein